MKPLSSFEQILSFVVMTLRQSQLQAAWPMKENQKFHLILVKSLAEAGKRVVLVDADIRKSVFFSRYQPDKSVNGLSHYLAGIDKLDNILCQTNIKNVYMIFAGKTVPNPSESSFIQVFGDHCSLEKVFDYVIIDCPPLGAVIDAAVIASHSDGAVIVVENNKISYKTAQKVKAQLVKSGCRIWGAVLIKLIQVQKVTTADMVVIMAATAAMVVTTVTKNNK